MSPEERRDKKLVHDRNRYAIRRGSRGKYTGEDVAEITLRQGNKCAICRRAFSKRLKPSVDHIVPLVKGGMNVRRNIQIVCRPCNSSKNDSDPVIYMQSKGLLL